MTKQHWGEGEWRPSPDMHVQPDAHNPSLSNLPAPPVTKVSVLVNGVPIELYALTEAVKRIERLLAEILDRMD